MKHILIIIITGMLLLLAGSSATFAQGTAFTYHGLLTQSGEPANGDHDFTFTLYDQATDGTAQAGSVETNGVPVTNGLFTVHLDFGASVFSGAPRWLEIAVKNSLTDNLPFILSPRQPVTPTPYAINAANLMSLANTPLDIKVAGQRALRLEPTARGEPNVIGGSASNYVATGYAGATIGGGHANVIVGDYATVGGGRLNSSSAFAATIAGGYRNQASSDSATVGGGHGNWAGHEASTIAGGADNTTSGDYSFIGGGSGNIASDGFAVIGGGLANISGGPASTVAGGEYNNASGWWATIGGGIFNLIVTESPRCTISGGESNRIYHVANASTISGGANNVILTPTGGKKIAGAVENSISDPALGATLLSGATISGGENNSIPFFHTHYSTIGGGSSNSCQGYAATISGGWGNTAAGYATVAGGQYNRSVGEFSAVSGGARNSSVREYGAIGGGEANSVSGAYSTVGGGRGNASGGFAATVAGGYENQAGEQAATVGGGQDNRAEYEASTIAGGAGNTASADYTTVGGGSGNTSSGGFAMVGGGLANTSSSGMATIGGGANNLSSAPYATVPGGSENVAGGRYSFAAGRAAHALHDGAFVWADAWASNYVSMPFPSTAANEFSVRATGGVRFISAVDTNGTPAAGVTLAAGSGSWSMLSDRNAKENFSAANARALLDKVAALPLATWNYKSQDKSIRHIGPIAQDFHAAFGLGESDRTIATVDADGVALAAIQGLNQKLEEQLKAKHSQIETLQHRIERLEKLISTLSASK